MCRSRKPRLPLPKTAPPAAQMKMHPPSPMRNQKRRNTDPADEDLRHEAPCVPADSVWAPLSAAPVRADWLVFSVRRCRVPVHEAPGEIPEHTNCLAVVVVAANGLLYRLASGEKAKLLLRTNRPHSSSPMIQTHNFLFWSCPKESLCVKAGSLSFITKRTPYNF